MQDILPVLVSSYLFRQDMLKVLLCHFRQDMLLALINLELLGLTCQRPSGLFLLKSFLEESTSPKTEARFYHHSLQHPCKSPPVWETSNVVKEAELGNYHQQTEEFGYLAMGPVQGFPPVVLPSPGVGVLWGYPLPYPYPYPDFDYRLLYGLYPPGTYTTFSKEHKG
ncbi:hypothetical protein XENOCAPTIV_018829 [Xenoophorus captivus]|uniref:Uncharacterized protein n=1 Tax=Xenoophorus captivus TaxID=1517983 RepID=A0ABV0RZE6_9TELE